MFFFVLFTGHLCDPGLTRRTGRCGGLKDRRQNHAGLQFVSTGWRCVPPSCQAGPDDDDDEGLVLFWQVNGWDMTVVTHDQARKKLTKKNEHVVRLLVTRKTLEEAVKQSMSRPGPSPAPSPFGTADTTALRPLGGDGAKPQSDQTLFQFCSTGEKWDERKMTFN